jgi:hypothetical protein
MNSDPFNIKYLYSFIIIRAFTKLRKATISFVISVCPSVLLSTWNNSAPSERIIMKWHLSIFRKYVYRFQVPLKSNKNNGTWHAQLRAFMISHSLKLVMRNILDKVVEKIKTHFRFKAFSRKSCLYENVEKCDRTIQATDDTIIRHMSIAFMITKATDIHSEDITLRVSLFHCNNVRRKRLSFTSVHTLPLSYYN